MSAAVQMCRALGGDGGSVRAFVAGGKRRFERELFDGEYFHQKVEWRTLKAKYPQFYVTEYSAYLAESAPRLTVMATLPEVLAVTEEERPPFQYGEGCLSTGLFGEWLALVCGLNAVCDVE